MKKVGKVKDAHGLKGDLYILVFSGEVGWSRQLTHFYLMNPESKQSLESTFKYTVDFAKAHKDGLLVRSPEIIDRTAAEKIRGFDFLIDDDLLISRPGETIYLNEILGFTVFDLKKGSLLPLGPITGFSSNGPQDILQILYADKTIEVPFVTAFIRNIDFSNRTVHMEIPEGLIEIFTD